MQVKPYKCVILKKNIVYLNTDISCISIRLLMYQEFI